MPEPQIAVAMKPQLRLMVNENEDTAEQSSAQFQLEFDDMTIEKSASPSSKRASGRASKYPE